MDPDRPTDPLDVDVASAVVVERPLADVAEFILEPANIPKWLKFATQATWETAPPLRLGSRLRIDRSARVGASSEFYEVCEYAPAEQISWRTVDGDQPLTMTFAWRPVSDRVTHMTLRYRVRGSSRWSAMAARLMIRRSMSADLTRLKKVLERDPTALL